MKRFALLLFPLLSICVTLTSCGENQKVEENIIDLCSPTIRQFLETNNSEAELNILKTEGLKSYDYQNIDIDLGDEIYDTQLFYDTDPEFSNPSYFFPDFGTYWMTVPGNKYYYRLYKLYGDDVFRQYSPHHDELKILPNSNILKEGSFTTKDDKVRFVKVAKSYNVRDLGGWETEDGKRTKYGMLYRGPEQDNPTSFAENQLGGQLGIKTEIDLRYGSSLGNTKFAVNYVNAGIDQYDLVVPTSNKYHSYTAESMNLIFTILSKKSNYPIYYHCAVGADRTGTVSFLLNGLLGVPLEQAIKEFELTSFSSVGYRCRGPLTSPYTFGQYQSDSQNHIDMGAFLEGIKSYSDEQNLSFQQYVINFLTRAYGIAEETLSNIRKLLLK